MTVVANDNTRTATAKPVAVRLSAVSKTYGKSAVAALHDVDLEVAQGELLCILGRSGCGKSTLLSIVAGLEKPTSGVVDLGGRRVGMMFQDANLFPWLTVEGNIDLALRLSGVPRVERQARIAELLEVVRLPGAGAKRPHELSGGMRQRVALARSLAQDCSILLMDEPFGALDAITRDAMHDQTERIQAERGITILFVTHNVREAARLGDRVIVMAPGPGHISDELAIQLPRPRQMEDATVAAKAAELHELLRINEEEAARG
ncbi:MAG: ABC transporter ATP-binding protein [Microbacteriaceae bacterium]